MNQIVTNYGTLTGVTWLEIDNNGKIKECLLKEENSIVTEHGTFIPKYIQNEVRDKYTKSLSFFKSGNIKSIALQGQQSITTAYGTILAELITFYEDGSIKRIFPLNGKLTGYWEEAEEYNLAEDLFFDLPIGKINSKCISLYFYPSGSLKSITLWPKEVAKITTPIGQVETHNGFSFYEDGTLKGIEPHQITYITTPIGTVFAYDCQALGIHCDQPSLCFYEDGSVKSFKTSTDHIQVITLEGDAVTFKPKFIPSAIDPEELETVPLKVTFSGEYVQFNESEMYHMGECNFTVKHLEHNPSNKCGACATCNGCKN